MTKSQEEIARTITADSRLVVWREADGPSGLAHPQCLIVPDHTTAAILQNELPTGSQGMVEIIELMPVERAAALIEATRRLTDARRSVERAEQDLDRRGTDLERAVRESRRGGNASVPNPD